MLGGARARVKVGARVGFKGGGWATLERVKLSQAQSSSGSGLAAAGWSDAAPFTQLERVIEHGCAAQHHRDAVPLALHAHQLLPAAKAAEAAAAHHFLARFPCETLR